MVTHVTPINDLKEHKESSNCWCEPKIEMSNGEKLVIHNSADHREYFEKGRKKAIN